MASIKSRVRRGGGHVDGVTAADPSKKHYSPHNWRINKKRIWSHSDCFWVYGGDVNLMGDNPTYPEEMGINKEKWYYSDKAYCDEHKDINN